MIDTTMRALRMCALGFAMVAMVGCSDDTTTQTDCETSADCALNAVCTDGKCVADIPTCVVDDDCGAGICVANECQAGCRTDEACGPDSVCISNTCRERDCDGSEECGPGARCVSNICIPITQCGAVGEVCDPLVATNAGFTCVDQGNGPVCALSCEEQVSCLTNGAVATRNTCPQGSICSGTACLPSNCDPARLNADCAALTAANPALVPAGSNCQKVVIQLSSDGDNFKTDDDQNYAYRCVAPSSAARGAACGVGGGIGQPTVNCQAGLKCISDEYLNGIFTQGANVCEIPCARDGDCPAGESCLGEQVNRFDGAGVCGVACKPFDVDSEVCAGGTCMPMGDNDGRCLNTGATGGGKPYDACSGNGANCPSGTVCVASQCTPICDPTRKNQPERDSTCFSGEPTTYARFIHLAQAAGPVDIYVDGKKIVDDLAFDGLAAGDNGWFSLTPGLHNVDVVANTATTNQRPLLSITTTLTENTGTNFFALPGEGAAALRVVGVAEERAVVAPAANTSRLRVVHAVAGVANVDIITTARDADVTVAANRAVLGANVAFGGVAAPLLNTTTSYVQRPAGIVDVYIFPAGGPYTQVGALAVFQDVTIPPNQRTNVVAHGAPAKGVAPALKLVEHRAYKHIPSSSAYCFDLASNNGAVTRPGWGICLQKCEGGALDYGTGACDSANAGCSPFGDNISVCLGDRGPLAVGATCGGAQDCADGLFCDRDSTGAGVCRSYCTLGAPNPSLPGCRAGETCQASELIPGLGECRVACQPAAPGDFKDTTRCPANQQSCYPEDGNFYCRPSGTTAVGASCVVDGDLSDACAPGSLCVRNHSNVQSGLEQLIEAFVNFAPMEEAFCRKVCRPFKGAGEASDCGADEACLPVLPSQDLNTAAGVCFPKAAGVDAKFELCDGDDAGKMCRDGGVCQKSFETPVGGGDMCTQEGSCIQFCDYATQRGCLPGQRCVVNGGVGNRQLIFGVYGICQDEN
jgi:hypothetical protein